MTLRPLAGRDLAGPPSSRSAVARDVPRVGHVATWRTVLALAVLGLGALSLLAVAPGPAISWVAWLTMGFVAGALSSRVGAVWSVLPLIGGAALLAWASGAPGTDRPYWWLGAVLGMVVASVGFVVASALGAGDGVGATIAASWRASATWARRLAVAAWAGLAAFVLVYTAYVGVEGARQFMTTQAGQPACTTPARAFGWPYEAINYDIASDARLTTRPTGDGTWRCVAGPVGHRVVSDDGVALAGWYIPAASGVGPDRPTVLVVPGYNDGKADILKYGPAFHDVADLVLMDLRNVGQSDRAPTTVGFRERWDVRAMVDWLVETKGATTIVLAGDSMGAASALAEAVGDPRVDGLILDSMHASWVVANGSALEADFQHPSLPGAWAMTLGMSARAGGDVTSVDPVQMLPRLGDRPVLLSHGTADLIDRPAESLESNLRAAKDAGIPVEVHYCPGSPHGQTVDRCPTAFAHWVTSFLEGVRSD